MVERCEQDVEAPFDTRGMQASFTQLEEPPAARQQPLVLVVDDNSVNRKLIARMLQHCDVDYELACNGKEAVEKMLTSQNHTGNEGDPYYHMILMDLSMPVMDGIEATRLLREHGMEIPVLALTANTVDSHKQAALDAGATEFLTKPILRDDLRAKCLAYCVV